MPVLASSNVRLLYVSANQNALDAMMNRVANINVNVSTRLAWNIVMMLVAADITN